MDDAVAALSRGEVIGIANGRAEFGPRALGNRSLISDPRGLDVKSKVNKIKKRELFRPFAPVVMQQYAKDYFDLAYPHSPYMQYVAKCKRPDLIPAVCHADEISRVQTLTRTQNKVFYDLMQKFYQKTGCPLLLNTSLNIKGEPLVNTWEDAMKFSDINQVEVY